MARSKSRKAYLVAVHSGSDKEAVYVVLTEASAEALIAAAVAVGCDPHETAIVGALSRNVVRKLGLKPETPVRI